MDALVCLDWQPKEENSVALKLTTRNENGVTVVLCNGRIVFGEESSQLRDQIKSLLTQSKKIVLNLGGVSYIDSGGLGILVALYTSARSSGGDIKLANLTQRVGDILQITKLSTIFEVYEGEQKAISAFS
jgi:anti-sigma B factor antagonist